MVQVFVRDYMTPNPITITKDVPVLEALQIMNQHKIRKLPVMEKGRLCGLVTERILLKVSPSPATTLSVYELNYLISQMPVKDVMITSPLTVPPDTTIEEAALVMYNHRVTSLLVTERQDLVGIITQDDLFRAIVQVFGMQRPGSRITISAEDRVGLLADLTQVIKGAGINIISLVCRQMDGGMVDITMRLNTASPKEVVEMLTAHGYAIKHVL